MCQCVQTNVMPGLTHVKMIQPVLKTGCMVTLKIKTEITFVQ